MNLIELFSRASRAFQDLNPELIKSPNPDIKVPKDNVIRIRRRGIMNQTEKNFSFILEGRKRRGEIIRYDFEGITLRWSDMRYTPDFIVFPSFPGAQIVMIEVKGGHIWERDIVRFKGARAYWPQFAFQMWQKTKEGIWKKKY